MNNESESLVFELAIQRIKLLSFEMDESVPLSEAKKASITLAQNLSYSLEKETITLLLKAVFLSEEKNKPFIQGVVQNVFKVKNLEDIVIISEDNKITLPENLITTILSLSISHSRALLAQSLMGSIYQQVYIPLVNPSHLIQNLFNEKS